MKNYHVQGPQIHQFNNVAPRPIPRSMFKRDFTRRKTFEGDFLIPIMVDEILPGDDISINLDALVRFATPIKPIMDNVYIDTFAFIVPMRLLHDNWELLQGQQNTPTDDTDVLLPALNMDLERYENETIHDYLGLPTYVSNTFMPVHTPTYHRAYNRIFNEWMREQAFQDAVFQTSANTGEDASEYTLLRRNKRKDFASSSLPWPQKGDPITIPLGTVAPIRASAGMAGGDPFSIINQDGSGYVNLLADSTNLQYTGDPGAESRRLFADLGSATAVTINDLRQAALYQQILELDARSGSRYVESLYSRFGVVSPDFRLQRPELIGQGSTRMNIFGVAQNSPTTDGTPQGNLAAYGNAVLDGHSARYSATEHCVLMYLLNVRADLTYQNTLHKRFTRRSRLDFYEPLLNGLGEQPVLGHEVHVASSSLELNNTVFGYQERFYEYRYYPSTIHGKFKSNDPVTLDLWHLAQEFSDNPVLSTEFIQSDTPWDRVIAVPSEPTFLADMHFRYTHTRPMPVRSNPGIDRL